MSISVVLATLCSLFNFPGTPAVQPAIKGDYVEARTASVFAGACHYNGEVVTTGRDAVLALRITSGEYGGVDLAGVTAMAAVTSEANLSEAGAARRSEIIVDSTASSAQAQAMLAVLRAHCGKALGQIVSVRRGPVSFQHVGSGYEVDADGFAVLSVDAMPNNECCKQPNLVWYSPLVQLIGRKVGYTHTAAYRAGTLGDCWERSGENSAFYGAFAF
jgi:hypothetical protein